MRGRERDRNLALAYWIDELVRSGQVADLAAVAEDVRGVAGEGQQGNLLYRSTRV